MNNDMVKKKAEELVREMTLEEKVSQLVHKSPAIDRLGIPAYNWWNEALHGVARAGTATMFPQAIAMAAMFDEEMMTKIGDAIATEGRAKYNEFSKKDDRDIYKGLTFWTPNVNIFRDPRWGRGHETYGEDPYLSSRLGVAMIRGIQGEDDQNAYRKAAACAKHFAVHSGPESLRHEFNAVVSRKDLYETYLPAFEACVKEGKVEAVMGAYNRTNGEPCCGSKTLLQDILRNDWGFEGHVVSDCGAIRDFHVNHMVTDTAEESAAMALKNGCDLNCGCVFQHLLKAYEDGMVTEEEIDTAVIRLLSTRIRLGLFDAECEYHRIPYEKAACKEHRELALETARKSMVLLKNNGILPLNKDKLKAIAVIGPNADNRILLRANYYGTSDENITLLEGIKREAGSGIRVFYAQGCELTGNRADRLTEAVAAAEHSDAVILCLGLDATLEGEQGDVSNQDESGDKKDLRLPGLQQELLEAVCAVGKPVVVLSGSGSALDLRYADEHADAIMQVWYPGGNGGLAAAELLFGKYSPGGKLPVTFYRSSEELPDFEDYSMKGRTYRYMEQESLYSFGYGLTYSRVELKRISSEHINVQEGTPVEITISIKNTGDMDIDEVVQAYIRDESSPWAVPNVSLCGFRRVSLKSGEETEVTLTINERAFTIVDDQGRRYRDSNQFKLYVGISCPDQRSVELTGQKPVEFFITSQ